MSTTEVLRCQILSPTPPSFRSARRPCCSCRRCWPPNDAAVALARAGERWAAIGRRCWCCAGSSTAPGWPSWPATMRSAPPTAYRYLHEGIDALAAAAPGLRGALLAARAAGHTHVHVDGTLIRTDRCSVPGPTARTGHPDRRVDLWWSGKHAGHGGNIQVVTVPDGWPIWTSGVRPPGV